MACEPEGTRAKQREMVSRNIQALLISAPHGLSVREIQSDYAQMIGKPLPFRDLGFSTILDLLKALPEVARPSWVNGELILRGRPCNAHYSLSLCVKLLVFVLEVGGQFCLSVSCCCCCCCCCCFLLLFFIVFHLILFCSCFIF